MTLHTLNNSVLVSLLLKSVSSVTEVGKFRRQSHLRGMDGKSRKLGSAKGVVNIPICVAGPRAPLRSNLDDPEEWELPCSNGESVCWDEAHRTEPVACRPIIKCGTTGCTGSCPTPVVGHGYTAGKEPDTCGICGKTNWVSRNVLPREQSAPFGDVEKEVLLEATSCPWEPREPGLFSSGYGKASEHAVISSFLVSAVVGTSEPAVISSFSAEVTAPSPCPLRNVTSTESSGESHGTVTVTRTAQRMPSAHLVPVVPSGVELVSRASYISRKKRNRETCWRQSKALNSAQPEVKRKLVAQPEIRHEAAVAILGNQAARTDEKFPWIIHISHQLALSHDHENVFFCTQCGAVNAGGSLRPLKSLCDGSGEARKKARRKLERGLMPNEHGVADGAQCKRAQYFLDVVGCPDSPCIVNLTSKKKVT